MIILGLDPGLAICGFGVIAKDPKTSQIKLLDYGRILTTNRFSSALRLKMIYEGISDIIKKHRPNEMAIEELFFVQNVKTGIAVGQARGVALLAAAEANLPVFEYKPTQIKLALAGYGRAGKKQIQDMVKLILGLKKPIKQDDTADAIAIAICHIHHMPNRSAKS